MRRRSKLPIGLMILSAVLGLLAPVAGGGAPAASDRPYPLGVVIDPGGNQVPTRQQQQRHYQWVADLGMNIIESEMLPVADGYLSWGGVQTAADQFNWASYDGVVEDAEEAGLDVMLELHTWTWLPDWLVERYPDMLMRTPLGGADELTIVKREPGGEDINTMPSFADERFVEAAVDYTRQVVRRYADRERVRGYIIAEERGLPGIWPAGNYYGIDFSPAMRDRYQQHLRDKFNTVDALNEAWGHPGRYSDFDEVVWRAGWAHEPEQYRGEWLEYYRVLQRVFADYHNRLARAIHGEDPGAIVMVSDWAPMVNRVGHGAYPPLLTEIDAIGFKSYWNDPRMQMDFCGGISGGKDVWITNLSERETTQGGIEQRYLVSQYVRRAFWASYARGCQGVFLFVWTPAQPEKMSLLEPQPDGSLAPIPAIGTVSVLAGFLEQWQPILAAFEPLPPRIVLHDPNLTFIADFWNHADPTPMRAKWHSEAPPTQRYHQAVDTLAALNRRFTISTDETIDAVLADPSLEVFMLTGSDYLDDPTLHRVVQWIEQGRPTILDDSTGRFNALGEPRNALAKYHGRKNVLTLRGQRWDREPAQLRRVQRFLDEHLPLAYRESGGAGAEQFTLDLMRDDAGNELAIIVRRGPASESDGALRIVVDWQDPHTERVALDPFADAPVAPEDAHWEPFGDGVITLPPDRDVLLVLTR